MIKILCFCLIILISTIFDSYAYLTDNLMYSGWDGISILDNEGNRSPFLNTWDYGYGGDVNFYGSNVYLTVQDRSQNQLYQILKMDNDGNILGKTVLDKEKYVKASAIDNTGNIYVATQKSREDGFVIERYNSQGGVDLIYKEDMAALNRTDSFIQDMILGPNGDIFVSSDFYSARIHGTEVIKLTPLGEKDVYYQGLTGDFSNGTEAFTNMVFDANNNLIIARIQNFPFIDSNIISVSPDGERKVLFNDFKIGWGTDMAFNNNELYVTYPTSFYRIGVLSSDGNLINENFFTDANNNSINGFNFIPSEFYAPNISAVPEPATLLLLGMGGIGLAIRKRFQKNS